MPYRGRLIWPFTAEIVRLDTAGTAAVVSPIGGGYDPDFREPVILPTGESARTELDPIRIMCQVETETNAFNLLRLMGASANSPQFNINLVFHYEELELLDLVDPSTGEPRIQVGDRLAGIYTSDTAEVVRLFDRTPLYATQVRDHSHGLSALRRNLLLVTFEDRQAGVEGMPA